ncbi:MAG: VOC family protein, partial [Saprospiraceae bacterium]|nr:VOC family protein [Saprospiraceae bacterium]
MTQVNNPFGLNTITPYLVIDGVSKLLPYLQEVFGAELRGAPQVRDDGTIKHAEVRIGDSVLMMGEPMGDFRPMPTTLYMYVDNCDETYQKALEHGGISVLEVCNFPHGDRYGGVQDPTGNIWWIVT